MSDLAFTVDDVMRLAPDRFQARVRRLDRERLRRERDPAGYAARRAARRASLLQRTPAWADHAAIAAVYALCAARCRETGVVHHVDHEIPLQGRLVSGLHVHQNLRVVTAHENQRKHNRW